MTPRSCWLLSGLRRSLVRPRTERLVWSTPFPWCCDSASPVHPSLITSRSFSPRPVNNDETNNSSHEGQQSEPDVGHRSNLEEDIAKQTDKQTRAPWHREGSSKPPVGRRRSAGAMTKGKLLTTPSHLLKLVVPLTTLDRNSDRKDVEPLSLLVHPQQPLSYLERLIQSELPTIDDGAGRDKIPSVAFWAEETDRSELEQSPDKALENDRESELTKTKIQGETAETGKLNSTGVPVEQPGFKGSSVEAYSGLGREGPSSEEKDKNFVRWSSSTEIGDFIREAARGQEFAVRIQGLPREIRIGVPSFKDRTHYLRLRFASVSKKISDMAAIKRECDLAAHNSAQRLAIAGGVGLAGYWMAVCSLTFYTDLGWDVMEPVTYLVGLSTLICGYLWFVYHRREVSYQAAMQLTVSRRQSMLYQSKGLNIKRWENLVDEANQIRREINTVARAYDVEWDELAEQKEEVVEALKEGTKGKGKSKKNDNDEDDDD